MSVFLYLAVLLTALYGVSKLLLPEMAKPVVNPIRKSSPRSGLKNEIRPNETEKRNEKLEILLAEKNKNIQLLQTELTIFLVQVREFDKIKNLLDEEIHRLREQNRILRSEFGMPAVGIKENSII